MIDSFIFWIIIMLATMQIIQIGIFIERTIRYHLKKRKRDLWKL